MEKDKPITNVEKNMLETDSSRGFVETARHFAVKLEDPDNWVDQSEVSVDIGALKDDTYEVRLSLGDTLTTETVAADSDTMTTIEPVGSRHVDVRPFAGKVWGTVTASTELNARAMFFP